MTDQLQMFNQTMLKDTPKPISSLGSASGHTHSDRQVSQTKRPCGQDHAPANRSAQQGAEQAQQTSDISGRNSTVWSRSAALQSSLVSRLQVRLAPLGSTLYKLTWRKKTTPQGWSYSQLVASAHRTKDKGSIGLAKTHWPTPLGQDQIGSARTTTQAQKWSDPSSRQQMSHTSLDAARLAHWPTPAQRDHKGGYQSGRIRNGKISTDTLDVATQLTGPARLTAIGQIQIGSTAEMTNGGQLNPAHSRWLMGLPTEWDDCAATVTLSSRRKRKHS
jgi:hypothetical protein